MGIRNNHYHCSGCESLISCERGLRFGSENCDSYVRNSYHNCHKCLRFGQACQRSGLVKCDFLPRITEDPFEKLNILKKETQSV